MRPVAAQCQAPPGQGRRGVLEESYHHPNQLYGQTSQAEGGPLQL